MDNVEGNTTDLDFIPEIDFNELTPGGGTTTGNQEPEGEGGENIEPSPGQTTITVPEEEEGTIDQPRQISPEEIKRVRETQEEGQEEEGSAPKEGAEETKTFEYAEGEDPTAVGIYKTMVQEGIINEREDFQGSFDNIRDYIADMPNRVANALYEQAPEHGKAMLDYVFVKGENLQPDDLKDFIQTYLGDIEAASEPDLSTTESSEVYLRKSLADKGVRAPIIESTIGALLEKDPDGALLKEEAKADWDAGAETRKAAHVQKLEQEKAAKAESERRSREFASAVISELDNTGWQPTKITEVKKALSQNLVQQSLQHIFSNPKAYGQLAAILTLYNPQDNTFDLKDFAVQANSGKTKGIKKNLIQDNFSSLGSNAKPVEEAKTDEGRSIWDDLSPIM